MSIEGEPLVSVSDVVSLLRDKSDYVAVVHDDLELLAQVHKCLPQWRRLEDDKELWPDGSIDGLTQPAWGWLERLGYLSQHGTESGKFTRLGQQYADIPPSLRLPSLYRDVLLWWTHWLLMSNPSHGMWRYVFRQYYPLYGLRAYQAYGETDVVELTSDSAARLIYERVGGKDGKRLMIASDMLGIDYEKAQTWVMTVARKVFETYCAHDGGLAALGLFRYVDDPQKEAGLDRAWRLPSYLPKRLMTACILSLMLDDVDRLSVDDLIAHPMGPTNLFGAHPDIVRRYAVNIHRHSVIDDYYALLYSPFICYYSSKNDELLRTHHFGDAISEWGDLAKVMSSRNYKGSWVWEKRLLDAEDHDPGDCYDHKDNLDKHYLPPYERW